MLPVQIKHQQFPSSFMTCLLDPIGGLPNLEASHTIHSELLSSLNTMSFNLKAHTHKGISPGDIYVPAKGALYEEL